jgi:hypothetical protein
MPKKYSENLQARPDIKQCAVEMHEPSKNRLIGQETRVGMARPYTAEIICRLNQASLRMESSTKRSRGRPKNTWQRTMFEEAKEINKTWAEIKVEAKNRVRWKIPVKALCSAAERWDAIYIYIYTCS